MEQVNFTDERDIHIKFGRTAMPDTIGGVTRARGALDDFAVLINSTLDDKHQAKAFLHEMLHVYHRDAWSDLDREAIEAERRAELRELLQLLIEEEEQTA